MNPLLNRFVRYIKVNTRSDASSSTVPTTVGQIEFAKILEKDLQEIGLSSIRFNEQNSFLTALLPTNTTKKIPAIGFIAHLDTADYNAENIQPQVFPNYDGKDVIMNQDLNIIMSVDEFPNLTDYIGETLVTTDGTTLLGADDKAGIVEILDAIEYLIAHPEVEHGDIHIAFGPDEEIGRGADRFDAPNFPVAFAYTIDSGRVGHFEYETFNAAQAVIKIDGISVHPGTAYGSMINAIKVGEQLDHLLPTTEVPEQTKGYEGFYLLTKFSGSIDHAELVYIIRDHDKENFHSRKQFLKDTVTDLNNSLDKDRITITFLDQYYNMKEIIEKDMHCVDIALKAMKNLEIEPIVEPFRGGTDGSKISFMGIPTPNLFTGGENFHGQYEFITVESMQKAAKTIVEIIKETAQTIEN